MTRAWVVVNRNARRLRAGGPLLDELCRRRPGVEVFETRGGADLDAAMRAVRSRADGEGPGSRPAVVLAGGDGSYMAGVSALVRAFGDRPLPPVALAPGGTVSVVARNWGMRGDPVRYATRLLDAIAGGTARATRRPTLRVREARDDDAHAARDGADAHAARGATTPGRRERVGFIFGAGLVARFFEVYEARGAGGNVAAARIVARVFAGSVVGSRFARSVLDPNACEVSVDGAPAPFDRVSLLCASVVRHVGLGMRLTPRAGEALDRFHVVGTPLGPRALGPQMPLVLAARPLLGPRVDALATELRLRFPDGAGAYVLDGDLLHADAVTVTAGPALDVVG
ncbi:MAG: hypothetical protein KF782_14510 [Labilithrix sp.]|nr:hypothetical protein [Labilithrix sp.]